MIKRQSGGQGGKETRRQGDKEIIRITDILGQEVLSTEIPVYERRFLWDASDILNKMYFVTVTVGTITETTQLVHV